MKKALVVFLSPVHMPAFSVFMNSLLNTNEWFDLPVIAIETGMTPYYKEKAREIYSNIEFRRPKYELYDHFVKNIGLIRINYYKLDAYSYEEFEKIVMLDLDMVIQGDISYLFNNDIDLGMVQRYDSTNDRMLNETNGGLVVIGKKYLNRKTYLDILNFSKNGFQFSEQDAQNRYFKGKITFIDKIYNCEKRMCYSKDLSILYDYADRRILHFIGPKPWELQTEKKFIEINKYWHSLNQYKVDKKRVLIIGNAPSALNNNGKEIDKFDIVIRLNNFKIKGFENKIGTKTDYILMGYCIPYSEELCNYDPSIMHVFPGEHNNNLAYVKKRMFQDHENPNFKGCRLDIDEMNILDEYYYYGMRMKIGLAGNQRSTIGTIAIEWAMNNFAGCEINYTGIEFFQGGNKQHHYFNYVTNKNRFHDHLMEKRYVGILESKGYVKKW